MNKVRPNKKSESGITLIALIVMIIILVILSGIVIKGITGEEGIISTAEVTAEEYKIAEYKEEIEQGVRNSIVKQGMAGEEITINKIAKDLIEEVEIVETAEAEKGKKEEGNIIVGVERYKFQVYYNGTYGEIYVEYIGTERNGAFPNIEASYSTPNIKVETNITGGKIAKTEIKYKGNIVAEEKSGKSITYKVDKEKTGWYEIKAETEKGNKKYAYIRAAIISDKIKVASIELTPKEADGEDKWYKKEVKATITQTNGTEAKIYYTLSGTQILKETEYKGEIAINKSGITIITAWVNKNGEESRKITKAVKVDVDKPQIGDVTIEGTKGRTEGSGSSAYTWITSTGEIKITAQEADKRKWNKRI